MRRMPKLTINWFAFITYPALIAMAVFGKISWWVLLALILMTVKVESKHG